MPKEDQQSLQAIFEEMLTEWEIFINNQGQLVKDARGILKRLERSKK